ncbi:hypothetical protein PAHAL_1G304000 [Panicum hallii]|uniref:Uncharacterized protein n=1 Tax=Panicum hallii TaxID=206008 RepID=A0A2T8KWX9_9POAL|nr:hypothetical protein PAHAL_1G304000 [Panicum hallii]
MRFQFSLPFPKHLISPSASRLSLVWISPVPRMHLSFSCHECLAGASQPSAPPLVASVSHQTCWCAVACSSLQFDGGITRFDGTNAQLELDSAAWPVDSTANKLDLASPVLDSMADELNSTAT